MADGSNTVDEQNSARVPSGDPSTGADLTIRVDAERANQEASDTRIAFDHLVAELLVQFINLPPQHVDQAILDGLRRIGDVLDLDRCTFYSLQPDWLLVHPLSWERAGVARLPDGVPAAERFPWALEIARAGGTVCFSRLDDIPNEIDRESYRAFGMRSSVAVPLPVGGQMKGVVGFDMVREERDWSPETIQSLRLIGMAFGNVLARRGSDEALRAVLVEIGRLRDELQVENVYLRHEVRELTGAPIVGRSAVLQRVLEQVHQVAATDSTVLILGETGTGKEVFANAIHELSGRRGHVMVRVNCGAIPPTLVESELFGHEKGAYTGALARQMGRFELADQSTIFLDEIGDVPLDVQVKLLRVLEERQFERLGSAKPVRVNTRIIAATHQNLEQKIAEGAFRSDLFYRLNVFPIHVPPLRDRADDIPLLVRRFVEELSKTLGKPIEHISSENMAALQRYRWPGNVRELRNVVERAMILTRGPRLTIAVPTSALPTPTIQSARLADIETEHIRKVLQSTGWRIRGAGGAADRLGLRPTTLETRMARLGLKRPRASDASLSSDDSSSDIS
jgi:formate hydrogenlyase transcriptional activator